jgi:hypothetical protein
VPLVSLLDHPWLNTRRQAISRQGSFGLYPIPESSTKLSKAYRALPPLMHVPAHSRMRGSHQARRHTTERSAQRPCRRAQPMPWPRQHAAVLGARQR